ncbi:hypothetical protein [Amnibacterium kyonggiense]
MTSQSPCSSARFPASGLTRRTILISAAIIVASTSALMTACTSTAVDQSAHEVRRTTRPSSTPMPTPVASDEGPGRYAEGRAQELQPGEYHYVVATGDTLIGIAARFSVCVADVETGLPLAEQGDFLAAGTPVDVRLGRWPTNRRGAVECTS